MRFIRRAVVGLSILTVGLATVPALAAAARPQQSAANQAQTQSLLTQQVGTVKAINGNTLTLTPGSGSPLGEPCNTPPKLCRSRPGRRI